MTRAAGFRATRASPGGRVLAGGGASVVNPAEELLLEVAGGGFLRSDTPTGRRLRQQIELAAGSSAPVLLQGEFGTGKEAVARAIHAQSPLRSGPFLRASLDLLPLPAAGRAPGRDQVTNVLSAMLESAEWSAAPTILLLGLDSLPASGQAALGEWIRKRGAESPGRNWRWITAVNRDVQPEVVAGRFDAELLRDLSVLRFELAPLRERGDEIPSLAQSLAATAARRFNRPVPLVTPAQSRLLCAHEWPGNIRELQNVIERGVILGSGGLLRLDFQSSGKARIAGREGPAAFSGAEVFTRDELRRRERDNLVAALACAQGRIFGPAGAARALGMKPTTLLSRIRALGIPRMAGRAANAAKVEVLSTPQQERPASRLRTDRRRAVAPPVEAPPLPASSPSFEVSFD